MTRTLCVLLVAPFLAYLAVVLGLYLGQRNFLYHPDDANPPAAAAGIEGLADIEVPTADGLRLHAWYKPPPDASAPVVLFFHGNGGNRASRTEHLAKFAAAGFGVLAIDYRGYGGNAGAPSETGLFEDGRAAIAFLAAQGIRPARIVAYGESLGTAVATHVAAETRVAALALEAPFTSMVAMGYHRYPYVPVGLLLADRFDSLSRIGTIKAPLFVASGLADATVPPAMGQALFDAAREPKERFVSPEAGHNDLLGHGATDAAIDFIRRQLGAAPR